MKKFMLGKKIGMTQVFDEEGISIPVTVIEAGPCTVVQKKTIETDGYEALKVAYGDVKEKRLNKPLKGQYIKAGVPFRKHLREFKVDNVNEYEIGQEIKVGDMFQAGDRVDVTGISKGKGYQGTTKRFGTSIGRMSHGSKYHRGVGSMGSSATPSRIFKGKKMPGHMGAEKVTVQNLNVVRVDPERNLLLLKGSVPGIKGGFLVIKETVKC
jgi:large subunit ribosomal protein L3